MSGEKRKRVKTYIKGRRLEYKVRDYFRNAGYLVIRSAKSGSPFDLVAISQEEILLIQVKSKKPSGLVKQNIAKIRTPKCCQKIIAYPSEKNYQFEFEYL